jgi:hypothetical protein
MITVINFYNADTRQIYVRLHPATMGDDEKNDLCRSLNALPAAHFGYSEKPATVNLVYFQEFDSNDTCGVYYNINGDKEIYDIINNYGRSPEYII